MEQQPQRKPVKTYYANTRKVATKTQLKRVINSSRPRRKILIGVRKPLTTKKAVELLIKGTLKRKVCRYCLNIAFPLSDLDQCLSIGGNGALYNVCIRDIVASFHPVKVADDPNFPNRICAKCINQALQAYLFAQQCEQAERALRNCFDDMYNKMLKLDPLEPTKKRGRQKNKPNHNVLYAEHAKVIDYADPIRHLINSGSISLTNETEMTELECKKCWQLLPDVESLANHEKIHPKSMWYHCRLCGQAFAKLFHIRRHLKSKHGNNSQPKVENENFMCRQCGFTSEDYSTHLQHIEKHKFKNVMEHLVERKMDELCSVCLDKGSLQNLEKTIRLHGAYPELTGNRSLYNILGSTIPEKGTHKYKELLVPRRANILTIRKNNTLVKRDKSKDKDLHIFTIAKPFIVSKERIDDKDFYLFIFSEPQLQLQSTSLINEENTVKNPTKSQQKSEDHDINETGENIAQNIFLFSNAEYVDDLIEVGNENLNLENFLEFEEESDVNRIVGETAMTIKEKVLNKKLNEHKTCQFCWVFTKAGKCDLCNNTFEVKNCDFIATQNYDDENVNDTIDSVEEKTKITQKKTNTDCKYCWVYKAAGKCDYCKTSIRNTSTEIESRETVTAVANELEDFNENKSKITKKRKFYETDKPNKKARWECSVCLTTNDGERESCLCCGSNTLRDDSVRINFGLNTSFLKGIPKVSKIQQSYTDEPNENDEASKSSNDNAFDSDKNKENISETKNEIFQKEICSPVYQSSSKSDDINDMQFSDDTKNVNADIGNVQEFAMDIEEYNIEDNPTIPCPFNPNPVQTFSHFLNAPNTNKDDSYTFVTPTVERSFIPPTHFQFTIGISPPEMKTARKFKRPIRGIATIKK